MAHFLLREMLSVDDRSGEPFLGSWASTDSCSTLQRLNKGQRVICTGGICPVRWEGIRIRTRDRLHPLNLGSGCPASFTVLGTATGSGLMLRSSVNSASI